MEIHQKDPKLELSPCGTPGLGKAGTACKEKEGHEQKPGEDTESTALQREKASENYLCGLKRDKQRRKGGIKRKSDNIKRSFRFLWSFLNF